MTPDEYRNLSDLTNSIQLGLYNGVEEPDFENLDIATIDPRSAAAQTEILDMLRQGSTGKGLNEAEQYELAQQQQQANQNERGNREALLQSYAQRGQGGGGASLAAQLSNQQSSADRLNMAGQGALGRAASRRLQSQSQYGQFANQLANQNIGLANQNQQNRQQSFQNRFNLTGARSNIIGQRGQNYENRGSAQYAQDERARQGVGDAIKGGLEAGAKVATGFLSDERLKSDIKDQRLTDVLSKIPAKHFKMDDEPQVGIIAQEIEKIPKAKEMVMEVDGLKGIDKDKAMGFTLAALGELSRRIDRMER